MWGASGLSRFMVVAFSAVTLLLLAAVGAAASTGTLGSPKAVKPVMSLVTSNAPMSATNKSESKGDDARDDNGKHKGECHPPKKHHQHSTPGHKHHPCGDDGGDDD